MAKKDSATGRITPAPKPIRDPAEWPLSVIGDEAQSLRMVIASRQRFASAFRLQHELPETAKPWLDKALSCLGTAQYYWKCGNDRRALEDLCHAHRYCGACFFGLGDPKAVRAELARSGARAKLKNDPKQAAKAVAFEQWQEWRTGKTLHKSGAAFARHVVATLPAIQSTKTVEAWVKKWSSAS
jgi:hypothetical protein